MDGDPTKDRAPDKEAGPAAENIYGDSTFKIIGLEKRALWLQSRVELENQARREAEEAYILVLGEWSETENTLHLLQERLQELEGQNSQALSLLSKLKQDLNDTKNIEKVTKRSRSKYRFATMALSVITVAIILWMWGSDIQELLTGLMARVRK